MFRRHFVSFHPLPQQALVQLACGNHAAALAAARHPGE
jgi:hypothetical protein